MYDTNHIIYFAYFLFFCTFIDITSITSISTQKPHSIIISSVEDNRWVPISRPIMNAPYQSFNTTMEDKPTASTLKSIPIDSMFHFTQNDSFINSELNSQPKLRILLSGAPCSGKGTQCEFLKAKYGVIHISTGDLLRDCSKEDTELAHEIKSYINNGLLVPDKLIIELVKVRLSQFDCKSKGWILDGFPRTINQAKALKADNIIPSHIFLLEAPRELLLRRSVNRRLDPITGRIYNVISTPPETEEIKARLIHRHDDTYEVMEKRLTKFDEESMAIREWYKDDLIALDGTLNASTTFREIREVIDKDL